jgi:ATP-dependent Lon protease
MYHPLFNKPLPILALRNLVLFPGVTVPIRVGRAQSIAAVRALASQFPNRTANQTTEKSADRDQPEQIIAVLQKPSEQKEYIGPDELHRVGVLCQVERIRGNEKDGFQLVLRGLERIAITDVFEEGGTLRGTPEVFRSDFDADPETIKALLDSVKVLAKQILEFIPTGADQMVTLVDGIQDLDFLINISAANIDLPVEQKQELLELHSLKARTLKLLEILQHTRDELQVRHEIRDKMTTKIGKSQREAILREQMRAIREELGEGGDEGPAKAEDYRKKIDDAGMPEAVRKVALDEVKRLEALGNQSPETHVIRNYLDLLVAVPWKATPDPEINLGKARDELNADHYGLDKIKKRIIEHLATMKLKEGGRGLILLFNGPPGVGKTSLGQSIAHALGRKFVRASLGGVRDDAEIRGHRRTYIGAMPGKIIQGLKRAGVTNPVFLLDEIDKLGRGYQGDPGSALLEVLDPEQNSTFTDHYMDVPYDLSKVLFIATANSLETIPGPLLDRMEVIELSGYTTMEKLHIAKNHLVPKQLKEHGIKEGQLLISDDVLHFVISHYTREAGVRDLERKIAGLCRASTIKIDEGVAVVTVVKEDLEDMLGAQRYDHEVAETLTPPGVTTGLAWTPVGGEILFIESALMPGTGRLTLTGQLGEVMKESAQIALSLIRSRLPQVSASLEFDKKDLHLHVPAGAIPKDGPSAGIAMLTSMASLFTGRPVNPKTAMTGEITLRGAVTPVGGVKEKIIAAHRAGIERVILARKNERDVREVPEEVKSKMQFHFVDNVAEVLSLALGLEIPKLDPNTGLWGELPPVLPVSPGVGSPTGVHTGFSVA